MLYCTVENSTELFTKLCLYRRRKMSRTNMRYVVFNVFINHCTINYYLETKNNVENKDIVKKWRNVWVKIRPKVSIKNMLNLPYLAKEIFKDCTLHSFEYPALDISKNRISRNFDSIERPVVRRSGDIKRILIRFLTLVALGSAQFPTKESHGHGWSGRLD